MALAQKPTDKNCLHPFAGRPDSSLWLSAPSERRTRPAEAFTRSWRARCERHAASLGRTEQPLHRGRLSGVEGRSCSLAAGSRTRPPGRASSLRLCLSLPVAWLFQKRLFTVGRRAGIWFGLFAPAGVAALSEFPELQRPDFMVTFPKPHRQLDLAHILVEEEMEEP
jgi:hypothetical protein